MHSVSSLSDAGDSGQTKEIKGDKTREEGVMSHWAKNKVAQRRRNKVETFQKLNSSQVCFFFPPLTHTHTQWISPTTLAKAEIERLRCCNQHVHRGGSIGPFLPRPLPRALPGDIFPRTCNSARRLSGDVATLRAISHRFLSRAALVEK